MSLAARLGVAQLEARRHARRVVVGAVLVAPAVVGCADLAGAADGRGDAFGDAARDLDASTTCAVLKLANLATADELVHGASLHPSAAREILAWRQGDDHTDGTADDVRFVGLDGLDPVPYVGPDALATMIEYVGWGGYACGEVPLQVLAINDFHGALHPASGSGGLVDDEPAGGVQYLATHLAALRAEQDESVLVSAGDLVGATPLLSALFHDEPTVEAMDLLGLDYAGVGNHEFDRGRDELLRLQAGGCEPHDGCALPHEFAGAKFQFLAANVIDERTDAPVLPATAIHWVGNARVAFVGVTLADTPRVVSADGIRGLSFEDELETIADVVDELGEDGIEAIVVLLHQAGGQQGAPEECEDFTGPLHDIAAAMHPAVDLVVAGHTDGPMVCEVGGRIVTSAASNGRMVTDIDLVVDELAGDVVSAHARQVVITHDVELDPAQTALLAAYAEVAAPLADRIVGSVDGDLPATPDAAGESPLGDIVADAQLAATLDTGAEIALTNPGGVRADLASGDVTYGELFAVQPFGNNLVTMTLDGDQLLRLLELQWSQDDLGPEQSNVLAVSDGFSYAWDPDAEIGARVVPGSVRYDGAPIEPDRPYRVTVNAFLAGGGDGFDVLLEGRDVQGGMIDLEALEAYVVDHSPVTMPTMGRITVK